ncbi:MAG: glycosyltransferase family 4 protein [Desulfobacteraceae bacterium]|nr:glycosyltransferase family 4 protein [Desulfobacteraceae bacterium]MBC2748992.1 glycosyltransferase family 4 protein [Desulfobacteraceae bacterium]
MPRILVLSKRQYTNKDLIDDRFGRLREIPLALSRRGYDVEGLCLSYTLKPEGRFQDEGVLWQSFNLSLLKLPKFIKYINTANRIAQKSDLIWACSDSIYGIIGFFIARRHNIPLVFDLYDNFEYFFFGRLPLIKQLYFLSLRKCAAVTCVSAPLAERIIVIRRRSNITVIENAVRTDIFKPMDKKGCRQFLGLPERGTFIGTAGAIHRNRGIETLFEAFQHLKVKIPDLHLVLAGRWDAGVPRSQDERIHYLGELPLEKVPFVFNSLDLGVICNLDNEFGRYCFPQKAHEITACHVSFIAANVGSMARFLSNTPHRLFQPGNAESLMQSIIFNLQNHTPIPSRQPTWNEMAQKMEMVIQNAIYPSDYGDNTLR